jgi:glycerol-3-phosphate acyltransferase PlsY
VTQGVLSPYASCLAVITGMCHHCLVCLQFLLATCYRFQYRSLASLVSFFLSILFFLSYCKWNWSLNFLFTFYEDNKLFYSLSVVLKYLKTCFLWTRTHYLKIWCDQVWHWHSGACVCIG